MPSECGYDLSADLLLCLLVVIAYWFFVYLMFICQLGLVGTGSLGLDGGGGGEG